MAKLTVVYWRDIPSSVVVKAGRNRARAALPARFQEAIDRAAMTTEKGGSEAYFDDWRRDVRDLEADDIALAANAEVTRLDDLYPDERVKAIVKRRGHDPQPGQQSGQQPNG